MRYRDTSATRALKCTSMHASTQWTRRASNARGLEASRVRKPLRPSGLEEAASFIESWRLEDEISQVFSRSGRLEGERSRGFSRAGSSRKLRRPSGLAEASSFVESGRLESEISLVLSSFFEFCGFDVLIIRELTYEVGSNVLIVREFTLERAASLTRPLKGHREIFE